MSAWKLQLNKPYSFYWLTYRWSLSAWGPWHFTGKERSTGSLDFCTSPLWSCGFLCVPQGTGSSLSSGRKDRELRWRGSEEQDLHVFPSLWAVLLPASWAFATSFWTKQWHNFIPGCFFFFSANTVLLSFKLKGMLHGTHMLSTLMTNRRSVSGWLNIPSSALIFWPSAASLIPSYAQTE